MNRTKEVGKERSKNGKIVGRKEGRKENDPK